MTRCATPTARDLEHVEAFHNFLSWGELPYREVQRTRGHVDPNLISRKVPPAWWAYALGHTTWCPPKGEL